MTPFIGALQEQIPEALVIKTPEYFDVDWLKETTKTLQSQDRVRPPIISLVGCEKYFNKGMSPKKIKTWDKGQKQQAYQAFYHFLLALRTYPNATLSFASGKVIGGGLAIFFSTDYPVARTETSFSLPELFWGAPPLFLFAALTPIVPFPILNFMAKSAEAVDADYFATHKILYKSLQSFDASNLSKIIKVARRIDWRARHQLNLNIVNRYFPEESLIDKIVNPNALRPDQLTL